LAGGPAQAYLCYLNARLDHALYDEHRPKTVAYVYIEKKEVEQPADSMVFMGPIKSVAYFRVKSVIMGTDSLQDQLLKIETTFFIWPEDLVDYAANNRCILILDRYAGEKDYRIVSVVPAYHDHFIQTTTNTAVLKILEAEILESLQHEKNEVHQAAFIHQAGPVLSKENVKTVMPFLQSGNIWVRRSALAAAVYATENQGLLEILASDIEGFFSQYDNEKETIKNIEGTSGYAPYPYYLQYVFFIDSGSMRWGSRWDENEATRNQKLYHKLIGTGRISKKIQDRIEKVI
jgi:hypothetical protein